MMPRKKQKNPTQVVLHLTENCNLRCKMCYFWGESGAYKVESQAKPKNLDLEVIKKVVEDLKEGRPKPYYNFFGGEPFLYPNFNDLLTLFKDYPFELQTNGILLKKYAEKLVESGIIGVKVSIDGIEEINNLQRGPGAYKKAIEGINLLGRIKKEMNSKLPRIDLIYTITPLNWKCMKEFFMDNEDLDYSVINQIEPQLVNFLTNEMGAEYAKWLKSEFGITSDKYWKGFIRELKDFGSIDVVELVKQTDEVFEYITNIGLNKNLHPPTYSVKNVSNFFKANWKGMEDLYDFCNFPFVGLDIMASGDVAPCHTFYDLILGNVYEESILDIWYGDKFNKLRQYITENKFCPACNIGCCMLYIAGNKKPFN